MRKKQFRKKDYKFRHDLGGLSVGYWEDWLSNEDGSPASYADQYDLAYKYFHKAKEKLNVGEYFSIHIFGDKIIAYRNEEGIFTK